MVAKEIWGNSCWYLFHATAFKLNPNAEHLIIPLLNLYISISLNLPCPTCRSHASKTIAKTNFSLIKNKSDLVNLMFNYHNYINKRLKKNIFTKEEHDKLYSRAKLTKIINGWIQIMSMESHNQQDMMNNITKRKLIQRVINFLKKNRAHFSP